MEGAKYEGVYLLSVLGGLTYETEQRVTRSNSISSDARSTPKGSSTGILLARSALEHGRSVCRANGQPVAAQSPLIVSAHISIPTPRKRQLCRVSPRRIRSRAHPLVLVLGRWWRWGQLFTAAACPVAFTGYDGGLALPDVAGGPEECAWDSVLPATSSGAGQITTAAPRDGGECGEG